MADLDPLIRVRRHTTRQRQKILAGLYRLAEDLQGEKMDLLDQLEVEQARAHELGVEMLSYLGPYTEAVQDRVAEIDEALKALEDRIQVAQEDMRLAFAELKKVEITQARREEAEKRALEKKEAHELDEAGLDGFRRRGDGESSE